MPQPEHTTYLRRFLILTLVTVVTPGVWYLLLGIVAMATDKFASLYPDRMLQELTISDTAVSLLMFAVLSLPVGVVFSVIMAAHDPKPRRTFLPFLFTRLLFVALLLFIETWFWPVRNGEQYGFFLYCFLPSQALGLFTGVLAHYGMRRWDPVKPEEGGGE